MLVFKDLGMQISWHTLYVLEYMGPFVLYVLTYLFPSLFYGELGVDYEHSYVQQFGL